MCGIVGMVELRGLVRDGVAPRLDGAVERLAPRGPSGRGTWMDQRCALGHTRLAIIDLSAAGAQPMSRHGRVITYNGEIYNHEILRRDLEARGYRFESRSDTEVILAGWDEWGADILPRLEGMFAFALWDPEAGELVLARDRFGKKPLVYSQKNSQLCFASEFIALEHIAGRTFDLDAAALRWLFTLRFLPDPLCIGRGGHKLPAGHFARFNHRGLQIARWYDLSASREARFAEETHATARLREVFEAAVLDRLVSDVPVGTFLSGGIDSAIVASTITRKAGRARTFTVGFEDSAPYYEERPAAARIAQYLGADHTEIVVSGRGATDLIAAVASGIDEPFADSSAVATYVVARETSRYVSVALSGDGADEVFGGYRKYQSEFLAGSYQRIPKAIRDGVIKPLMSLLPEGKQSRFLELARRARRFVAHADKSPAARQAGLMREMSDEELDTLLGPTPLESTPEDLVSTLRAAANDDDVLNEMLFADVTLGLTGDMLVKVDRMSMANGLEVRCPFLDHRVVECAAAMPGSFKLGPGIGKKILRRAFAADLPAELFRRPKKGFEIPVAQWLTRELADYAAFALDPVKLRQQGIFNPRLPQQWLSDLKAGRRDTSWSIWTLLIFQQWASVHNRPEAIH